MLGLYKSLLVTILTTSLCCYVNATVPLILYSHKLVPKIQSYVNNFNRYVIPTERINEVLTNLIEPCTSDAYVLVNQPGLTLDDLQNHEGFVFLRTYAFMSSTLGVIPRLDEPLDFDSLSSLIHRKCRTLDVEITKLDEIPTYIDNKKRLIRITLPELPQDPKKRIKALVASDDALRRTLRKLPSPHHTVIYTTLDDKLLNKLDEKRWQKLDIFADISKDQSRLQEFERNQNVEEVERPFPEKRTNLIDKKKNAAPKFLDKDLIHENEALIFGIFFITLVLAVYQFFKLLVFLFRKIKGTAKEDKPKKESEGKKEK